MENTVELLGWYGGDEAIALSAWTSTSRDLSEEKRNRIPKMIHSLWKEGHGTPFEKGIVHFIANTDIATHIQLLKHRIASINGESARYKELKEDKYYIPVDWIDNGTEEGSPAYWASELEKFNKYANQMYHYCLNDLTPILGRKRAKESARFFKPYSMQYQVDIMFNMRSFANFLKLRNSEHAQLEVREVAQKMQALVEDIEGNPFKHTLEAICK